MYFQVDWLGPVEETNPMRSGKSSQHSCHFYVALSNLSREKGG